MTSTPPDGFEWPAAWEPIASDDACLEYPRLTTETFGDELPACSLSVELQREVAPTHPLYRVACRAVARNGQDPKEFLFFTAHPRMPLAFVHLTWRKEELPDYPWMKGYESWEAFRQAWLDAPIE
jgi:hypothetical protein